MRLLNGSTSERVRNSEGCTVQPCGCAHTDVLWLQMCDAHASDWETLHNDATLEHATQPDDWLAV